MIDLVRESGYLDRAGELNVDSVREALHLDPRLVDEWIPYSMNQRVGSGWYVTERAPSSYEVGLFPNGERLEYSEATDACAEFIVRKLAELAARLR